MSQRIGSRYQNGLILRTMGLQALDDLSGEHRDLLETSSAIYESDGSLALQHVGSGWCRLLHGASQPPQDPADDGDAAASGQWLCQGSCCTDCSQKAVRTGHSVDMACPGGLQLHAEPIRAGGRV
ncbi:MAG: histidine kinase, partial [Oligoflexia bacterium]|nr:histidine kinase [Oligoflexia bacterium]